MADPMNGPEPAPAAQQATEAPEASDAPEAPASAEPAEPAGPRPLGVAAAPTGQAAVDAVLRRLAEADHLPVSGHLDMYEDVHRGLRDVLASLDQHPGPPAPSPTHDPAGPAGPNGRS
ncbi:MULTISPECIES: hypothetical protein [unclassified Streptomyces]|uniref:hypothetical protein n=1 Tax=unclassified Streptomyces TaxID=2593676 RepID=UPI0003A2C84E|nr:MULTISPECIES: hypothetical protein [unclassified Streptomyces]MYT29690.1 hypothetical protein [Streptomyces sp. SID8354]